jgi:hypothetical protein
MFMIAALIHRESLDDAKISRTRNYSSFLIHANGLILRSPCPKYSMPLQVVKPGGHLATTSAYRIPICDTELG